MTLQNRVDPWGVIHARPERGTMMGNRGGKFHRDGQTLGQRRWASHHWIACELHWKGLRHEPMGRGYTSLFFLDEVTALAAGHRPCFFCRGDEAKAFLGNRKADDFDRQLHAERLASANPPREAGRDCLPDGVMVEIDGAAFAVRGDHLLRWSFAGYTDAIRRNPSLQGKVLTPPAITAILRGHYQPRWHPTARV